MWSEPRLLARASATCTVPVLITMRFASSLPATPYPLDRHRRVPEGTIASHVHALPQIRAPHQLLPPLIGAVILLIEVPGFGAEALDNAPNLVMVRVPARQNHSSYFFNTNDMSEASLD